MLKQDMQIIRELVKQIAEIAALPVQEEKRTLWRKLNGKRPERPMVMIDQVCWHEMNVNDELTLQCEDDELRRWELQLRRTLYQWKHFPVDMVVEDFIRVPKAISGMDFGVKVKETVLPTDKSNDVVSHSYINQFESMDDLEKIKMPVVTHDSAETARRMALADEMFGGILKIREEGADPYLSVWDPVATWMGVENVLYGLVENPDLMHAIAKRMVDGYISMLDQLENQGLLCHPQSYIHCTGAWTDELPSKEFDPSRPKTKDIWMFGLAQLFSSVSPRMFYEFEIEVCRPIFERFGLVYYGCCDPLDGKMKEVRAIPNLRKVSMSPWANKERGAEQIGRDYVYSCKPNPAYLAAGTFDEELVRRDLLETKKICEKYGCALEIILKDISTVTYQPHRLWRWAEIAMEVAQS
ncbi:MAG TPA: hypothetical protein GX505_08365 [Clostridiales bacterium]|nr:hypothetical protein [Clostridiales bacterium]